MSILKAITKVIEENTTHISSSEYGGMTATSMTPEELAAEVVEGLDALGPEKTVEIKRTGDEISRAEKALYAIYWPDDDLSKAEPEAQASVNRDVLAVLDASGLLEKFPLLLTVEDLAKYEPGSWVVGEGDAGVFKKLFVFGEAKCWFSCKRDMVVPDEEVLPATLMLKG